MICEMCGKEVPRTREAVVEGSVLMVCQGCSRFGVQPGAKADKGPVLPGVVSDRLAAREKRYQEKDLLTEIVVELAHDYDAIIRSARAKRGLSQEELAKLVMEKVAVIKKVEAGELRPSEALRRKLEKALGVKLTEGLEQRSAPASSGKAKAMTLGDLIKRDDD
jgi:putative transcription factor